MPQFSSPPNHDAPSTAAHDSDDLNAQVAALFASGVQDTGDPTEEIHLDSLTDADKRILLALLRERMGLSAPAATPPETEARP